MFLIAFTIITGGLLLWDKHLGVMDGSILIVLLGMFLRYTLKETKKVDQKFDNLSLNLDISQRGKIWRNLIVSLILLLVCAQFIVFSGKNIAIYFQVPELIIGLTLIALGTSIPELAVAITSAIKKEWVFLIAFTIITGGLLLWDKHLGVMDGSISVSYTHLRAHET